MLSTSKCKFSYFLIYEFNEKGNVLGLFFDNANCVFTNLKSTE